MFGPQPAECHFLNIVFFIGCVLVFFFFLDKLFAGQKTGLAFIAALVFALHPVHTEVVANIKSRDELLCFFLAFLSINIFAGFVRSGKLSHLLSASALLFFSFLSKESVISFLFVIPFIFFFYLNENKKRSLVISLATGIIAISFLIIRAIVLKGHDSSAIPFLDNPLVNAPQFSSRIATAILVLGSYLKLLLIPYPLVCDYSYNSIPLVGFGNAAVILSLVAYLILLIFSISRLFKNIRDPWSFAILFFLSTLALFSNIPFLVYSEMAERFVFFASAGFCLAFGLGLEQFVVKLAFTDLELLRNKKIRGIVSVLALIYAAITMSRNAEWQDNLTLDRADIQKLPGNARLNFFLGNELLKTGEEKDELGRKQLAAEALNYLRKALTIYPDYADADRVMGNAYSFLSQYDSAVTYYHRAIAIHPLDVEAMNNLNVVYYGTQHYHEAVVIGYRIIDINKNDAEGYNNVAVFYIALKEYDSAINVLNTGRHVDKGFNAFYQNLAVAYKMKGNTDSAKMYEAIAQRQNPGFKIY